MLADAIVHTIRHRQCGNPKDRSYALYGALERFGFVQLPPSDYTPAKHRQQVYHELLVNLVRTEPLTLKLLIDAKLPLDTDSGSRDDTLPSWVPDWHLRLPDPTISATYFLHDNNCSMPLLGVSLSPTPTLTTVSDSRYMADGVGRLCFVPMSSNPSHQYRIPNRARETLAVQMQQYSTLSGPW